MFRSKEHLRPFFAQALVYLWIFILLNNSNPIYAQDYDGGTILIVPDLMPFIETEQQSLYDQAAFFAPDGAIVNFHYLQESSLWENAPVVNSDQLQFPLGQEYSPLTQQGYFAGHWAWDITYSSENEAEIIIQAPHSGAILLATFADIPLGRIAQRLQASGTMEVFYLNFDNGEEIKPYLILFAHLTPESASDAVSQALENNGSVTQVGAIGNTGLTDGTHLHLQVMDLTYLYQLFDTQDPIEAYGAFTDLENEITAEMLEQIFIDPSLFYSQLREI